MHTEEVSFLDSMKERNPVTGLYLMMISYSNFYIIKLGANKNPIKLVPKIHYQDLRAALPQKNKS